MEAKNKTYEKHTFKSFLCTYHVIIPMVQRDYAQGRINDDINQVRNRFLGAIKKYLLEYDSTYKVMKMDFVYGETEKVWSKTERNKLEETIVTPLDGQQRLTTLFLLHWFAAKKEKDLPPEEYNFLKNFTYDIRPSSRDFCSRLLTFTPASDSPIKEQLIDQYWFMGDWHNDPTIISMLTMLDAIRDKFSDVDNLWSLLTGADERIIFYFWPLAENGLSDELYIKMNSRGKKLTPFEHFKAEFEDLYERDSEESRRINHKFDVEWADMLFDYRDNNGLTDKEFMRYFFYISHILCYQQSVEEKSTDEFELIKLLYQGSPNAAQNREFFEKAMDCWWQVKKDFGSIGTFFAKYLTKYVHEKGKVTTYKNFEEYHSKKSTQNFFRACLKLYLVNNSFSYSDFLFLFGIITYLMNKTEIEESEFIERLRILRNLIWNSDSGEIRGDSDYMKDLLTEVEELMLNGTIKSDLRHSFNGLQEAEEIEKMKRKMEMSPEELELMYKYEDHPLIYGYVSGLGYEHLYLTDTFHDVFYKNWRDLSIIHQALISIGDYKQKDGARCYMANRYHSTWTRLQHKKRNRQNFEQSMSVLIELLKKVQGGKSITDITESFIKDQEEKGKYTWRYYFAKYPDMLRGLEGELVWYGSSDYLCTTLNKHQFNGQHWNSFLNVIYQTLAKELEDRYETKILNLDNYGENLKISDPASSIAVTGDGFDYFYGENKDHWQIAQDEDGIDTEDRVLWAIEKIKDIVQRHKEVRD